MFHGCFTIIKQINIHAWNKIQEKEKFWMVYVKQLAKQGSIKVTVCLLS